MTKYLTVSLGSLLLGLLLNSNLVFAQTCYTIIDTASRQTTNAGFVWKPISEGDHKLVVLFPASSGATGATLRFGGSIIENGRYVGRTNGNRPTIRFSQPGGAYPDGLQVCEAFGGAPPPPPPTPTPTPTPPEPEPKSITPIINILLD